MRGYRFFLGVFAAAAVATMAVGCAAPLTELSNDQGYSDSTLERHSNDPYVRTWQAMRMVLEREFGANNVQNITYPERQWRKMIVHSRISGDGGGLQRIEVRAWVTRNRYNEIEPVIICMHQLYRSDKPGHAVSPIIGDAMGARKVWLDLDTNDKMAAALLNQVYEALNGPSNFAGRYVPANKPAVEFAPKG